MSGPTEAARNRSLTSPSVGEAYQRLAVAGAGRDVLRAPFQFERTHWWSAERLRANPLLQLSRLIARAAVHVPSHKGRLQGLAGLGVGALSDAMLDTPPILTRA